MRKNLKVGLWHPFLVVIFPVLSLFAHNLVYVPAKLPLYALLALLPASGLLLWGLKFLFRGWHKAGVWVSIFWLSFFTYGAVASALVGKLPHLHLVLLFLNSILLVALFFYLARSKSSFHSGTRVLNLFSLFLVLLPLWQIGIYLARATGSPENTWKKAPVSWPVSKSPDNLPDIVYLILDGYGRKDVLENYYALNNQPFLDSLTAQGFSVLPQSAANYIQTSASVTSSLNLNYLQNLENFTPAWSYPDLKERAEHSRLFRWLQQFGYQLYSFDSGFSNTEFSERATSLAQRRYLPEFYRLLLNQTPFVMLENNAALNHWYNSTLEALGFPSFKERFSTHHQERILYALENVHRYIGQPKPSFVFADVLVAHPPFVFDQHGRYTHPFYRTNLSDGHEFLEGHPQRDSVYYHGLREQTLFLNQKLLQAVANLKRKMKRPTVIILQGDHGPGLHFHQRELAKTDLNERFPILNAIYASGPDSLSLPQDLTPVNTFRIILNQYFHTNLSLLPYRHYYSPAEPICQFTDVTQAVRQLPPNQ